LNQGFGGGPRSGRRLAIRSFIRANHKIKVPRIRCINSDGTMLGIVATKDALRMAQEQGVDLVEVSPNADPPVCRIMDFGKFRYEEGRKKKTARKNQQSHAVKEMKFHANVADHDYATKVAHIRDFLEKGLKVKISLTFRGRENAHRELGFQLVGRVLKDCETVGVVEMSPKMMGRSIIAMMGARAAK
jgi:translation initiation factor IF-3